MTPLLRLLLVVVIATGVAFLWANRGGQEQPEPTEPETDTAARAAEVFAGYYRPDPERIPSRLATNPGKPWGDYVGSGACKRCHEEDYDKWRSSFHSRTLYDAVAETVFGDFSGQVTFDDPEYQWIVEPSSRVDGETGRKRFFLEIRRRGFAEGGSRRFRDLDTYGAGELPDTTTGPFEVLYAFGNRRHQPYVVKDESGRSWVAPVYWDDIIKQWRYDGWRPYVRSCAHCHVTGIRSSDKPAYAGQAPLPYTQPKRWNLAPDKEQWAEGAVGCEVCHGPGRKHIEAVDRIGVAEYRRRLEAGTKERTIYDGRAADFDIGLQACGRCHDFFTENQCTWTPGPKGFTRPPLREPLQPRRDLTPHHERKVAQFYGDGSHMSPCTIFEVYKTSKMYKSQVGCGECHDPHGTKDWADLILPIDNNELCIKCHLEYESIEAQTRHSRHAADSGGNRCVECHMARTMAFSNGVHMMSREVHNHYFDIPTGKRRPGGPPSACNLCHDDRSHKWTREVLAKWKAEAEVELEKEAEGETEDK